MRAAQGHLFADDPAFKGKPRELVAADYVYSIKRAIDPNLRGGGDPALTDLIVGADPSSTRRARPGGKFDYDAPIGGCRRPTATRSFSARQPDYTLLDASRAADDGGRARGDRSARATTS